MAKIKQKTIDIDSDLVRELAISLGIIQPAAAPAELAHFLRLVYIWTLYFELSLLLCQFILVDTRRDCWSLSQQ